MKDSRHAAILEIISGRDVETQEELARELEARGFKVTQATISKVEIIMKGKKALKCFPGN